MENDQTDVWSVQVLEDRQRRHCVDNHWQGPRGNRESTRSYPRCPEAASDHRREKHGFLISLYLTLLASKQVTKRIPKTIEEAGRIVTKEVLPLLKSCALECFPGTFALL